MTSASPTLGTLMQVRRLASYEYIDIPSTEYQYATYNEANAISILSKGQATAVYNCKHNGHNRLYVIMSTIDTVNGCLLSDTNVRVTKSWGCHRAITDNVETAAYYKLLGYKVL